MRQLYAADVIALGHDHGSVLVTDKGRRVLAGEETVRLRVEAAAKPVKKAARAAAETAVSDTDLLARLKKKRFELAKAAGVPAYVVFADKTLIDLVNLRPTTKEQFAMAHGVGAKKLERYADAFLEEIRAYEKAG
jgi:ATP-dependent DNA helicase RecQ